MKVSLDREVNLGQLLIYLDGKGLRMHAQDVAIRSFVESLPPLPTPEEDKLKDIPEWFLDMRANWIINYYRVKEKDAPLLSWKDSANRLAKNLAKNKYSIRLFLDKKYDDEEKLTAFLYPIRNIGVQTRQDFIIIRRDMMKDIHEKTFLQYANPILESLGHIRACPAELIMDYCVMRDYTSDRNKNVITRTKNILANNKMSIGQIIDDYHKMDDFTTLEGAAEGIAWFLYEMVRTFREEFIKDELRTFKPFNREESK